MPEMKTDCFAHSGKSCAALNETICAKQDTCPFYATKAQAEADRDKAMARAVRAGYYLHSGKYAPMEG